MIKHLFIIVLLLSFSLVSMADSPASSSSTLQPLALNEYVVLAWNDLGMHCMNLDFRSLCILPPYNNLWAQVVRRGDFPQLVSQGVSISYRFPKNTTSSNKVNFWDYANKLFNVTLPPDIGLTGNGLSGAFSWNDTAFEVSGIPLTPFEDSAPTEERPYQVAWVTLSDANSGQQLDQTEIVAPVSVEIHCDKCHRESGATAEDDILNEHDEVNGKKLSTLKPVLCASCHESNALGTPKKPGIPSLSQAIHGKHAEEVQNISCYDCHPGQKTRCFRDVMFSLGMNCENCHGSLATVASSIRNGRRPWLDEPKCEQCHDSNHAVNQGKLYRQSRGHGGLYCEACHNSPHAILPTVQAEDNAQAIRVQGIAGAISKCTVCHITAPPANGPHGLKSTDVGDIAAWSEY